MCDITAQAEVERLNRLQLLSRLLEDKTSKRNIIWATDAYSQLGVDFERSREITAYLLTQTDFKLMNRAQKDMDRQTERTRAHAEVFTPVWIVKMMNDYVDTDWFGYEGAFEAKHVTFPENKTWKDYIDSRRLEITCGEAPYLVSRYDVSTGEYVPIAERIGLLDRKLRVVSENAVDEDEWLEWAFRAFESTYGYEFQGDNLLIARLNLLQTFEENLDSRFGRTPSLEEYGRLIDIITWNLWQMDGLTGRPPYSKPKKAPQQLSLFDMEPTSSPEQIELFEVNDRGEELLPCRIFDWRINKSVEYRQLQKGGRQ